MSTKVKLGLGWLTVGTVLFMCLMVVNARPDGVAASDGEQLVANVIAIPMFLAWLGGLSLIAWSFARD